MSEYRIFELAQFQKDLEQLPRQQAQFLRDKLVSYVYPQLRKIPFWGLNIKKLRGYNPATWRYRIGRYRLFYHIDDTDNIVYMLTVDQRKDSYR
ncbi:MAG: type II toxin-antitoxin system RelE family toxin [Candidatus Sumerlaeaceae bacterium]